MQLHNRVVARFADGHVVKGTTQDFAVTRDFFHVIPAEPGAAPVRVSVPQLKAVFFVRDFNGNPNYAEGKAFDGQSPGRRIEVTFTDHEVLLGSTLNYRPDGGGFFVLPADSGGNTGLVASA